MNNKINFIPRKFQNISSHEIVKFNELVKTHIQLPLGSIGFEKEHLSNISVVLGEPASGKTYQLEHYKNQNENNVYYKALINIEDKETIEETIEVILLDSIDEALINYKSPKILQKKLVDFIKNIQTKNKNIRFVISCRFLEWTEHFEKVLKEVDKELKVYNILDIESNDINKILDTKEIDRTDFRSFIKNNYLDFLLKNIIVTVEVINNYETYKIESINYTKIYKDIVKEHISVRGEEREEIAPDKPLEQLISTASSLAIYMKLNRKAVVSIENINKLADELYKVDNKSIVSNDLKIILNTSLFKKEGNNRFSFFHKSIQEYLVAYFIDYKTLDLETIKNLFSHKFRFYEEFEEVIIYLTNMQKTLLDELINFDPFIFKRHPSLDESQQQKLLLSMLNKLQNDKSMIFGKWSYFKNTTIVKFDKVKDIVKIIQKNVEIKKVDNALLPYLMKLLEYNYSAELEDFIFTILENITKDKSKLREMIEYSFIDNYYFNKRLFYFIKKYNLFDKDKISILDLETRLFESLYGIKHENRYGNKKAILIQTDFKFTELLPLLGYIPHEQLKYIVASLKEEDINIWFKYIKSIDNINPEYITWILYALLLNCHSKEIIENIINFLCTKHIYSHNVNKNEMSLKFNSIANYFWEVYLNLECEHLFDIQPLLKLLDISLFDIKEVVDEYPIKNNIEKYLQFRDKSKEIEEFLLQDKNIERYLLGIEKRRKNQEKKWNKNNKDLLKKSQEQKQKTKKYLDSIKQLYSDSVFHLSTKKDFYNIFILILRETQEPLEIDKKLREGLGKKYSFFIDKAKEEFKLDKTYLNLKNELTSNSLSNSPTFLFSYLFNILEQEDIYDLIYNKKNFEKLFWHSYKSINQINKEYFIGLSKKNFNIFINLIIESIRLSLVQSENKDIGDVYSLIEVIKKVGKFDSNSLFLVIEYLTEIPEETYKQVEPNKRRYLIEILSLDEEQSTFIYNLMQIDKENMSDYLNGLLSINVNSTLNDFMKEYNENKLYEFFKKTFFKTSYCNRKSELYKHLIKSLSEKNIQIINEIEIEYLQIILIEYYKLFNEYQRPTGCYSPDINDTMWDFINKLWNYLETTSKYIPLLEKLTISANERLSIHSKATLEKAYNQQNTERSQPNSYYKNILDKEIKISQSLTTELKNKWVRLSMYEKIGLIGSLASIIGLLLYFIPSSSPSNDVNINTNSQSPIIQHNNGNIIYNIDNSNNHIINNVNIKTKINNLMQQTIVNIKGKNKDEQKAINTKIFILGESKKINEKSISIEEKNKECKNKAGNATSLLNFELNLMNKVCDEIF